MAGRPVLVAHHRDVEQPPRDRAVRS
jgi:hypothetical protein